MNSVTNSGFYPNIHAMLTHAVDEPEQLEEVSYPVASSSQDTAAESIQFFDRSIDIQFTEAEMDYLQTVCNAYNFTGDISVFDWVHYHGYTNLLTIPNLPKDILDSYLTLYVLYTVVNSQKMILEKSQQNPHDERLRFYASLDKEEKFFPSQAIITKQENTVLSLIKIFGKAPLKSKSRRRIGNTSLVTSRNPTLKLIETNLAVLKKLTRLSVEDFLYLNFKKTAEMQRSFTKSLFWNEFMSYLDYMGKHFESVFNLGLSMFNPRQWVENIRNQYIESKQITDLDKKLRFIWGLSVDLGRSFKDSTRDFGEEMESVRLGKLTHKEWAKRRNIRIAVEKKDREFAAMLRCQTMVQSILASSLVVATNYYGSCVQKNQQLRCSHHVNFIFSSAAVDRCLVDTPIEMDERLQIENPEQQNVYNTFERKLNFTKQLFDKVMPEDSYKFIYDFFETGLNNNRMMLTVESLFETQESLESKGVSSIKKSILSQFEEVLNFLKRVKTETPDTDLQPLLNKLVALVHAHARFLHKVQACDSFLKIKIVSKEIKKPSFNNHLYSLIETNQYILTDSDFSPLFEEFQSYRQRPTDTLEAVEEPSISSEESESPISLEDETSPQPSEDVDVHQPVEGESSQKIHEIPVASCSSDPIQIPKKTVKVPKKSPKRNVSSSSEVSIPKAVPGKNRAGSPRAELGTRNVKGRKLVSYLKELGYTMTRQKGSHMIFSSGVKTLTVPNHTVLKTGTIGNILKNI